MLLIAIRIVYVAICSGAILFYLRSEGNQNIPPWILAHPVASFFILFAISQLVTLGDLFIRKKRVDIISAIYFGLLIGTLLSYLANLALQPIVAVQFQPLTQMLTLLILPYLCVTLLLQTKDDFRFIIPYIEFAREVKGGRPYLLDTSSIIDGRIADVIDTKIITAALIVPSFVLQELQDIADSSDKLRRNRGRRGLDVLDRLRKNPHIDVKLHEVKADQFKATTVDQRLVELAKTLAGCVVTNDFNLNKVASVQGVEVLNLNDLANALKPRYLPGEKMTIKIIKPGESFGQGVGYLDDGTMVVCEEASALIGKETDIVVKSVLQSSAGRMIFGRLPTAAEK